MLEILAGVLAITGALFFLAVGVAVFRVKDALSRINVLGPATAFGAPMIVVAVALGWTVESGFDLMLWVKTAVTVVALVMVSSVASNVLARATCRSDATLEPDTQPNDLRSDG
ncbi:cation:proton antiporter [Arachnia propionica]|uniref:Cation:proton antiporter n=1 Tax=Arachnia propionica TaxID=1750 RepID=A0A3P1TFT5_9ACTN|nr:cation:proton antiporter [Arachnia propionica]